MGDVDLLSTLGAVAIQRDVVRVHGPQAIEFLQGQLSQDIEAMAIGQSARTLLLQPTGKVEAWLRATRVADDEVLLDVESGFGEPVRARLARFKLRTKVDLEVSSQSGHAVRGPGADAVAPSGSLAAGWPSVEGFDVLEGPAPSDVPIVEADVLEALRIETGVPAMGAELTDATIPAEAGQWLIETSVSFTKGCYTGQELVARIDSRGGNVPRPLRGLLVEGEPVPVGTTVEVEGSQVGIVTSSARSSVLGAIALAPIARSVEPGTVVDLHAPDGTRRSATAAALPLR
jgi:folate-binding protein YgfZ